MKLNMPRRTKKRLVTRPAQLLTCPSNNVLAIDFMLETLYDGRPFKTFNVINEENLESLRIKVGRAMSNLWVIRIMRELEVYNGKPLAIRPNNDFELTAKSFRDEPRSKALSLV